MKWEYRRWIRIETGILQNPGLKSIPTSRNAPRRETNLCLDISTLYLTSLYKFAQHDSVLQLFLHHKSACKEKISGFDLAVDRSVSNVENCFRHTTLFNCKHPYLFRFQSDYTIVSLEKIITLEFEGILPSETCTPRVSPGDLESK
jgi:hypothetical protein